MLERAAKAALVDARRAAKAALVMFNRAAKAALAFPIPPCGGTVFRAHFRRD